MGHTIDIKDALVTRSNKSLPSEQISAPLSAAELELSSARYLGRSTSRILFQITHLCVKQIQRSD